MDPLIEELTTRGVLDPQTLDFARAYQSKYATTLESALLELDLIDEDGLLLGLESCYRMRAARPSDILHADPEVKKYLPQGVAKSFGICPIRFEQGTLICFVTSPLPKESALELRELFGVIAQPLLAPLHYVNLVSGIVYGAPVSERTRELEARLAERREVDVRGALQNLERGGSLASLTEQVVEFAAHFFAFSCFLVFKNQRLRVAAISGAPLTPGTALPIPEPDCPFRPAILHGGFYFGPLPTTDGARRFYASLQRPLPRWVFVAPAPAAAGTSVVFCADNGELGIAPRRVAELALLVARLGRRGGARPEPHERPAELIKKHDSQEQPRTLAPTAIERPEPSLEPAAANPSPAEQPPVSPPPTLKSGGPSSGAEDLTAEDLLVLAELRQAAASANMKLPEFVGDLLRHRSNQPGSDAATALVVEVKGLFDKLATDIPAHFARGIEGAFRDLAPRLAAHAPPPAAEGPAPPPAATVELVAKDPTPREVPDYKSRRRKATRVKL